MTERSGNRGLLVAAALAVVALVAGLFVLMSTDEAPKGTAPEPVEVAADDRGPDRTATMSAPGDRPTSRPAGKPATSAPTTGPKPPMVFDHSGEPQPDAAPGLAPAAAPVRNRIFELAGPAIAKCAPPERAGKPKDLLVMGFTIVVENGKVSLDEVQVGDSANVTPEHRECIKQAFQSVGFEPPAGQSDGRFPVTLQYAVP
jgi:hypothetical protein